jgi:hypothetical protein
MVLFFSSFSASFLGARKGRSRGGLFVILSRAQDARAKVKEDKRVNICAME